MGQLTINDLYKLITKEMAKGNGNKKIVISDDNEGNGYHGLFYGFTTDEKTIKDLSLFCSVCDTEQDLSKIVILG